MSEFVECETKIKDRKALIEALIEMGWRKDQIEVHDTPQHLYGYQGDKRSQTAHVIIRKQHVGSSSNDIGFLRKSDGTFEAIISEYDRGAQGSHAKHTHGYNDKWIKDLTGKYTEKLYTRVAKEKGYEVRRTVKGKKVILSLWK
jgi:hypothetical protein